VVRDAIGFRVAALGRWRCVTFVTVVAFLAASAVAQATFPGRPGRLAFSAATGNFLYDNDVLWDYDPRTKIRRRLTARGRACDPDDNAWVDGGPAYSPDGRRIAYLHWDNCGSGEPRYALRMMRADGSHNRRIAPLSYVDPPDENIAFAPNGRRLALFSHDGQRSVVTVFDVASAVRVSEAAWPGNNFTGLDWSVTGRIAGDLCCPGRIYTALPNGIGIRSVTSRRRKGSLTSSDESPEWSPTGRSIVFEREWWNYSCGEDPCPKGDGIWKVSPGRPAVHVRLPRNWTGLPRSWPTDVEKPIFSPDSREIAFIGADSGVIAATPATGDGPVRVLMRERRQIGQFWSLDWQPLPPRRR
jgi:hypothetical protein